MTLVKFHNAPARMRTNDLWRTAFNDFAAQPARPARPAVNIVETATGFRLEIAAPGLAREDFKLHLDKDVLTIAAKKENAETENGHTYLRREFAIGGFERAFRLPDSIDPDALTANYQNGILSVELNKKEAFLKGPRQIAVA